MEVIMKKSIKIILLLLLITSLSLITSCKEKYTVTFKDYNGTILKEGKDATPPVNPTREGYTFVGWTTPENNIPNLNVNISNETQDKTFTANFK